MNKIDVFAINLKREIKKNGYTIADFSRNVLKISIPTFNAKCNNGTFTVIDLLTIEDSLKTGYNALITAKDGVDYKRKNRKTIDPEKGPVKVKTGKEPNHGSSDLSYLDKLL